MVTIYASAGARTSFIAGWLILGIASLAAAQDAPWRVRVRDNMLPALAEARSLGAASREHQLDLALSLNISNRAALESLIEQLYDPASPQYRQFLTPEQFADQFGPSRNDYEAVIEFLKGSGMKVTATSRNRLMIAARASVARVERAFGVRINNYARPDKTFFANDRDPELPASIGAIVASVSGMENYLTLTSHVREGPRILRRPANAPAGYSPQQIAAAYDFTSVYRRGIRGAGQTLAIATAYGVEAQDVSSFWSYYGIAAPTYSVIAVGGNIGSTSVETTLDLERSGAMANGARILVYAAASPQVSTFQSVYNKIVTENVAAVVTTSWGVCEQEMPSAYRAADSAIFAEAAAQGQAWFAAAGDGGAYDYGTSTLAVDYPASDPHVAAAGGTTLNLTRTSTYLSEVAWSGSGGGLSVVFAEPAYQLGAGVTNTYSNGARQLADIAFDSDPNTGYSVYYEGAWSMWGGTSFAAPHWAAIFALANAFHGGRLGAAGAVLYGLANDDPAQTYPAFHDIVGGDNGHYPAVSYWDFPTGWGSPRVGNLVSDLE